MNSKNIQAAAKFIEERLAVCNYSLGEIAYLSGFQSVEMLEAIARGERRVPLDKVLRLADALGCEKRQLFILVLRSWFESEFANTIEDVFTSSSTSSAEQSWLNFLRELYGENIPELTPALRRRLRLFARVPN